MRIKILKQVTANLGGKSVPLREGSVVDVPEEEADMLVRGHYAALLDATIPAVKVAGRTKKSAQPALKAD